VDWVSEAKEKKSLRRRIANLYYDHGMTGPEIAEEVGLDRSNVYRHLKTYREKGA
jgi:DNA-binding transcriptional regulator LsrR (DeoR family)